MDKLMRAEAAHCKLKKRVCKHKKATSEARWETDQAYVALGNLHTQMEQVDQQRAAAQEARADDQTVLVGLQEQLEAAPCQGVQSYAPVDPSKQSCSYGRSRTRQDPRLEHIVGPCREGLAPVACTDPERSS